MENFLTNNQLYVVLIVVLVIWLGLFVLLTSVDKKITTLEKKVNSLLKNSEQKE